MGFLFGIARGLAGVGAVLQPHRDGDRVERAHRLRDGRLQVRGRRHRALDHVRAHEAVLRVPPVPA